MEVTKSVFIAIITLANLLKGHFLINVIEFGQLIKCEDVMLLFGVFSVYCILGGPVPTLNRYPLIIISHR